jgi:hypothetical protein
MKEDNRRLLIFGVLGLIWGVSVFIIMAPSLGLANPIFPRPQPDYELYSMVVSGVLLVGYSLNNAISNFRPN